MEKEFEYRVYTKGELAMLYFPTHSKYNASRNLHRWIINCKDLMRELEDAGYSSTRRFYSRKEVEAIAKYLGEP